ncbi:MAG: DnaJ domain-containing protein [Candidatus Heimdallarchaeota archaeon]|nr:MAG: DnaJ domain-containing protein [Candidatus Heimdallarchaeota archaeon]
MSIKEAYEVLGLSYPTNLQNVKLRFRKLAKKFHPDVNDAEDATEVFQKVYDAYEIILESLGESRKSIRTEFEDDLAWFYEQKEGIITADMDPFEVRYEHFWRAKIEKMLENLKKQKMKNRTQ